MSIMNKTHLKIAANLEQAFTQHGFTELGVDGLKEKAQVSLRTLYKYCPSKEEMILLALEHRHQRYLDYITADDTSCSAPQALNTFWNNVESWLENEAPNGCLFHGAVAAHPHNTAMFDMLKRHKMDVIEHVMSTTQLWDQKEALYVLYEGVLHSWPVIKKKAITNAIALSVSLCHGSTSH